MVQCVYIQGCVVHQGDSSQGDTDDNPDVYNMGSTHIKHDITQCQTLPRPNVLVSGLELPV